MYVVSAQCANLVFALRDPVNLKISIIGKYTASGFRFYWTHSTPSQNPSVSWYQCDKCQLFHWISYKMLARTHFFATGLGKYWKLNRSSRWRHYLTNFHRKKNWYLSRKLMTINEVLWINPDFRTMVVRYCVWWPEFLVSNILRCSATHVKANTRLERVRR